jgi:hypothetical protein
MGESAKHGMGSWPINPAIRDSGAAVPHLPPAAQPRSILFARRFFKAFQ